MNLFSLHFYLSPLSFCILHPPFRAHLGVSAVRSLWIQAHFLCPKRSQPLNWLSNFYIIRYRQVGGARIAGWRSRGRCLLGYSPRGDRSTAWADGTELIKDDLLIFSTVEYKLWKTRALSRGGSGMNTFSFTKKHQFLKKIKLHFIICSWKMEVRCHTN